MLAGLAGQVIVILLGIVIPRLFLIYFGSETNGFLNSVNQIFSYFTLFEAGVGTAALQALYGPVARKDEGAISSIIAATEQFYRRTGIVYIIAVAALAWIYPAVVRAEIPGKTMAVVILLNGLGGAVAYLFQGKFMILLRAEGKNYVISLITMIVNIAASLCKVFLIYSGCSLIVIQASYLFMCVLQMLLYEIYIRKNYRWINRKAFPDYRAVEQKNSVLVHQLSTLVFGNTDVILLTVLSGDLKLVSVYTTYNMVIGMGNVVVNQINGAVTFRLGQLYQTNQKKYFVYHHYYEVFNMILVFTIFTVMYVLLQPFIALYTSGVHDIDYEMKGLTLLFVLIPLISNARQASACLINYAGHFAKTQSRALIETGINLGVSIAGILRFGIYGALFGTIAALLYRANDMILYTYRHIIGENPWKTYRRWAVNFLLFVFLVLGTAQKDFFVDSYGKLFFEAAVVSVAVAAIYITVNMLFEYKMAADMWCRITGRGRGKQDV